MSLLVLAGQHSINSGTDSRGVNGHRERGIVTKHRAIHRFSGRRCPSGSGKRWFEIPIHEFAFKTPFDNNYLYVIVLPRILDLLDTHNVKATFSIIGNELELESYRNFCKTALQKGHMLANC